jgi:uncharacterized protein
MVLRYMIFIYMALVPQTVFAQGGHLLLIEHYVAPSEIHGLGVFSVNFVPVGAVVWEAHPLIDREIGAAELASLPNHVVRMLQHHSEFIPSRNVFRLSADGDFYMNHSDSANIWVDGDHVFAVRDIHPGEEITCDYRQNRVMGFDPDHSPLKVVV